MKIFCGQCLIELHREKPSGHQTFQVVFHLCRVVRAVNVKCRLTHVERCEERKAHDMIQVEVGHKNVEVQRCRVSCFDEMISQFFDSGPGIDNDELSSFGLHCRTNGMPPVFHPVLP